MYTPCRPGKGKFVTVSNNTYVILDETSGMVLEPARILEEPRNVIAYAEDSIEVVWTVRTFSHFKVL